MTFPVNIQDEISMTLASIELSKTALIFEYTVNNYSPRRVYLLNTLFRRRGPDGFQIDPNAIYAMLAPGPTLSLSKQLLIVPDGLATEEAEVPFVSPLEPRWTMTETLRLPLPIEAWHPYKPQAQAAESELVTQFTFSLGYVFEDQDLDLREVTLLDGSRQMQPDYGEVVQRQRLKRSAPVNAVVPTFFVTSAARVPNKDVER